MCACVCVLNRLAEKDRVLRVHADFYRALNGRSTKEMKRVWLDPGLEVPAAGETANQPVGDVYSAGPYSSASASAGPAPLRCDTKPTRAATAQQLCI